MTPLALVLVLATGSDAGLAQDCAAHPVACAAELRALEYLADVAQTRREACERRAADLDLELQIQGAALAQARAIVAPGPPPLDLAPYLIAGSVGVVIGVVLGLAIGM